ncbi:hypothetical protein G3M48_004443 [Beauveria asiatica]|uniref:F-box domain-containing protein n=1 Tax=Beauveria asiatica TaxID=1069075 RepID=A0AAW0RU23_9HYPO
MSQFFGNSTFLLGRYLATNLAVNRAFAMARGFIESFPVEIRLLIYRECSFTDLAHLATLCRTTLNEVGDCTRSAVIDIEDIRLLTRPAITPFLHRICSNILDLRVELPPPNNIYDYSCHRVTWRMLFGIMQHMRNLRTLEITGDVIYVSGDLQSIVQSLPQIPLQEATIYIGNSASVQLFRHCSILNLKTLRITADPIEMFEHQDPVDNNVTHLEVWSTQETLLNSITRGSLPSVDRRIYHLIGLYFPTLRSLSFTQIGKH